MVGRGAGREEEKSTRRRNRVYGCCFFLREIFDCFKGSGGRGVIESLICLLHCFL